MWLRHWRMSGEVSVVKPEHYRPKFYIIVVTLVSYIRKNVLILETCSIVRIFKVVNVLLCITE